MKITPAQDDKTLWHISGKINFDSVTLLSERGCQLITSSDQLNLNFDFSKSDCRDSSGLALMLSWLRCAKRSNKEVKFIDIPSSLLRISEICGVKSMLGDLRENNSHG